MLEQDPKNFPMLKNLKIHFLNQPGSLFIRLAKRGDAPGLLSIYRPYVLHTSFTPESEVPSLSTFREKIKEVNTVYPYLICLVNDQIAGYAYAHQYRQASGHQWSVETTIYCSPEFQGKGIAGVLYRTLFDILKLQGFINVFAGIILPNDKSVIFHKRFNFTQVGIFEKGILKAGIWHDVLWMQSALKDHTENPPLPLTLPEIVNTVSFRNIMNKKNDPVN